jgi:hypothetical protein
MRSGGPGRHAASAIDAAARNASSLMVAVLSSSSIRSPSRFSGPNVSVKSKGSSCVVQPYWSGCRAVTTSTS